MRPKTYSTPQGDVTVLDYKHTFWGNTACIMARVRGTQEAYFDEDTEIYQMEEHADGTWTAWYYSTNPRLCANRDELVRLGAWDR